MTSVYGIRRLVAATIELAYLKGLTASFFGNHLDGTVDAATLVVTAEHTAELSTRHRQGDVTIDDGILGSAKDGIHVSLRHTLHDNVHVARHFGLTAGTVDVDNIQTVTAVR